MLPVGGAKVVSLVKVEVVVAPQQLDNRDKLELKDHTGFNHDRQR